MASAPALGAGDCRFKSCLDDSCMIRALVCSLDCHSRPGGFDPRIVRLCFGSSVVKSTRLKIGVSLVQVQPEASIYRKELCQKEQAKQSGLPRSLLCSFFLRSFIERERSSVRRSKQSSRSGDVRRPPSFAPSSSALSILPRKHYGNAPVS
jgi:hypothetical protein